MHRLIHRVFWCARRGFGGESAGACGIVSIRAGRSPKSTPISCPEPDTLCVHQSVAAALVTMALSGDGDGPWLVLDRRCVGGMFAWSPMSTPNLAYEAEMPRAMDSWEACLWRWACAIMAAWA